MDFSSLLRNVAPAIAGVIGSPIAGVAVNAMLDTLLPAEKAEELKSAPEKHKQAELAKALQSATPEQLAEIKKIEADVTVQLQKLANENLAIREGGIADARQREIALGDKTVSHIGYAVLVIWLLLNLLTFYMIFSGVEFTSTQVSIVSRVLGTLDMAVAAVVHYFLGSSEGSRRKDK